jgi:hypothetical protein
MVRTHLFWRENANIEIYFFHDEAENTLVMVPWLEAREQRFEPVFLDLAKIDARILEKEEERRRRRGGARRTAARPGGRPGDGTLVFWTQGGRQRRHAVPPLRPRRRGAAGAREIPKR